MTEILTFTERVNKIPEIIQGGMGIGVSDWCLAGEVAGEGGLGVVSGTAADVVMARRLQDGDLTGAMRYALEHFPDQKIANKIIDDYYLPNGRAPDQPYKKVPMTTFKTHGLGPVEDLNMAAAFAEVWLAKNLARNSGRQSGMVGINLLTKLQLPTFSALYGAMLADVDCIVMGAGIPKDMPRAIDNMANRQPAKTKFYVTGSSAENDIIFDPAKYPEIENNNEKPAFLAIAASNTLATKLSSNNSLTSHVDGLIIEGPTAGGHNAPARDKILDERDQPIYGDRDKVIIEKIIKLGLPFWLAGSYGTPEGLIEAKEQGANGIQVGSVFALCEESGMDSSLREQLIEQILAGDISILTSSKASPTGFPFKVVEGVSKERDRRLCDLGGLREAYVRETVDGLEKIAYRCSAEPEPRYILKNGDIERTMGRLCLCNGLLSTIGLGQTYNGEKERPIVTLGDQAPEVVRRLVGRYGLHFSAGNVMDFLRDRE